MQNHLFVVRKKDNKFYIYIGTFSKPLQRWLIEESLNIFCTYYLEFIYSGFP